MALIQPPHEGPLLYATPPRAQSLARRRALLAALALLALLALPLALAWSRVALQGALAGGRPVPPWGPGFRSYSLLGSALGRQYLQPGARDALVAAFAALHARDPERTFVVGETGWRRGGPFWPHRTHRAGLSADVFVPVRDASGRPAALGTWPWQGLGYAHELDAAGREGALTLDFDALAGLLLEVEAQAEARGLRLSRIILAPELQPALLGSPAGRRLGALAGALQRTPAWVRHDEHVHLDFAPR